MTWSKFDDAAPKSPKAVIAGNEAWALWAAAVMYCNRHLTDGYITLAALANDCLPRPISPARAKKLAEELCAAAQRPDGKGLFEKDRNDMYRVHDFLDWNPSKVEVEQKRKKDRERKRGGTHEESGGIPRGIPDGIPPDSETPRASARALPDPPVPSRPEEREPPTPEQRLQARRQQDALTGDAPGRRPDVLRVHEAWKRAFGRQNSKFRNDLDEDAYRIADAIQAHGEENCLLVARFAPNDDMVSGRADEKHAKHESIRYIFGNEDAFSRILAAAEKGRASQTRLTPSQIVAELKARPAGAA